MQASIDASTDDRFCKPGRNLQFPTTRRAETHLLSGLEFYSEAVVWDCKAFNINSIMFDIELRKHLQRQLMSHYLLPVESSERPSGGSEVPFSCPFPEHLRPQHGCRLFIYIYAVPVVAVVMLPSLCFLQTDEFVLRCKPF